MHTVKGTQVGAVRPQSARGMPTFSSVCDRKLTTPPPVRALACVFACMYVGVLDADDLSFFLSGTCTYVCTRVLDGFMCERYTALYEGVRNMCGCSICKHPQQKQHM
jgi:hypothetical protein